MPSRYRELISKPSSSGRFDACPPCVYPLTEWGPAAFCVYHPADRQRIAVDIELDGNGRS